MDDILDNQLLGSPEGEQSSNVNDVDFSFLGQDSPAGMGLNGLPEGYEGKSPAILALEGAFGKDAEDMSQDPKDLIQQFLEENPGAGPDEILEYLASQDSEWAEKWLDYLLEKQSLEEQNAYTAGREDTAYQRLVQDLKKAGLNPAMLYGSSASISAGGSLGYIKQSEGANSRSVKNSKTAFDMMYSMLKYALEVAKTSANFIKFW